MSETFVELPEQEAYSDFWLNKESLYQYSWPRIEELYQISYSF
jgi:hypothetical protein